jgi:hypothetical protein
LIDSDTLPPMEDFYGKVTLTAYVPTNELQKINAAVTLMQNTPYPSARALERLDVSDPETAFREWAQEQEDKAAAQEKAKEISFEADLDRQRRTFEFQQGMQQKMQGQQQEPNMASQQPMNPQNPVAQTAFANTQGQRFDTNMGGASATTAEDQMLREMLTGSGKQVSEGADYRGLGVPPKGREAVK